MKGDFTRSTFNKEKHYSSVRMQQGRILLDADWNEQQDLTTYRVESEALDIIGFSGTPHDLDEGHGFELTIEGNEIFIDKGHYYIGGVLCENGQKITVKNQPDLPSDNQDQPKNPFLVTKQDKSVTRLDPPAAGNYLVYLETWQRHITTHDAPELREKALGGPDTATRNKTNWQVKFLFLDETNINCQTDIPLWTEITKQSTGMLAAKADKELASKDLCSLVSSAGYRRLENQLYRVEVHNGGKFGEATFKWSRDNGSIVTKWESHDENKLIVCTTGMDKVLNFAPGQWVELTDDYHELMGIPGTIIQLALVEDSLNILTLDPTSATYNLDSFGQNRKVRRWDMKDGLIKPTNSNLIELEDGIFINFQNGTFKTGDYWLIPARTANADIEWPQDELSKPNLMTPHGVNHQFSKLAILNFANNNWKLLHDCRKIFPQITELTNLLYVSGDGQTAMPNKLLNETLRLRVLNGQIPVKGKVIRLTIEGGGDITFGESRNNSYNDTKNTLSTDTKLKSITDTIKTIENGTASFKWTLGTTGKQTITAELLDCSGIPIPGQVIYFNANLSIAGDIAFNTNNCINWSDPEKITTVEAALNNLCAQLSKGWCYSMIISTQDDFNKVYNLVDQLNANSKESNNISICIKPGDYKLDQNLKFIKGNDKSTNHLKITGCSEGVNIFIVKEQTVTFNSYSSVTLKDLNIKVIGTPGNGPISFENCKDVEITSCHILSYEITNDNCLLKIGASNQIHFTNNLIESYVNKENGELSKVFDNSFPPLAEIMDIEDTQSREDKIYEIFDNISKQDLKTRRQVSTNMKNEYKIAKETLKDNEDQILTEMSRAISKPKLDENELKSIIGRMPNYKASNEPGNALIIMDAKADTWICNNHIKGIISIYGDTVETSHNALFNRFPVFESLCRKAEKKVSILTIKAGREFRCSGNQITRLALSSAIINKVLSLFDIVNTYDTIIELDEKKLNEIGIHYLENKSQYDIITHEFQIEKPAVFLRSYISENTFEESKNEFMAENIQLNSNSFGLKGSAQIGCAFGISLIFNGNFAPRPLGENKNIKFFDFCSETAQSANLNISS